jgi:hypothetical protein
MSLKIKKVFKLSLLLCILITLISCTKSIPNEVADESKLNEDLVSQCLSISLEFEKLQDIDLRIDYIDTIIVGEAAYAYLLDENYNILEHPNQEFIGNNLVDITGELFVDPLDQLVENKSHLFYVYNFDNIERLTFFYKAENNDILVITGLETYK